MPVRKPVPKFCFLFAKIALPVGTGAEKKKVENSTRLISSDNFDARELWWHVKKTDDRKQIPNDCRDEIVAGEDATTKKYKTETGH